MAPTDLQEPEAREYNHHRFVFSAELLSFVVVEQLRLLARPPDASKNTILDLKPMGDKPAFKGPGGKDYACGACGAILMEGVRPGQISGMVLKCSCGAFNQT